MEDSARRIVLLTLTTDIHEESCGLSATAELPCLSLEQITQFSVSRMENLANSLPATLAVNTTS